MHYMKSKRDLLFVTVSIAAVVLPLLILCSVRYKQETEHYISEQCLVSQCVIERKLLCTYVFSPSNTALSML